MEFVFHCHCSQGNALPEMGKTEIEGNIQRKGERLMAILLSEYLRSLGWGQFQSLGFVVTGPEGDSCR